MRCVIVTESNGILCNCIYRKLSIYVVHGPCHVLGIWSAPGPWCRPEHGRRHSGVSVDCSRLIFLSLLLSSVVHWSYRSVYRHVKDLIILTSGVQVMSLMSNYFWLLWLLVGALTNLLYYSLYSTKESYIHGILVIVYFGNSTGTVERELDALEADFGSMVLRPAARTSRDERKEDAQVREENGEATLMKIRHCCAIRKFHWMTID